MKTLLLFISAILGQIIAQPTKDSQPLKDRTSELQTVGEVLSTKYPKYYKMIKSVYLDPMFNDRDVTVFAISDQTINNFTEAEKYTLEVDLSTVYSIVLYQTVFGVALPSSFFHDGLFVLTGLHNKAFINIKMENGQSQVWFQGKRILKTDIRAKRGVIHEIEGIVTPPDGSLTEHLRRKGHFENFLTTLQRAQLLLPSGFTVFAPQDDTFWQIPENERVFYLGNRESNKELANMHIVPRPIFTSLIGDKPLTVATVHRRYITLTRTKDGITLSVDQKGSSSTKSSIRLLETDIAVNNGIIHVISDFIRPGLEATSIAQKLQSMNVTRFYNGILKAGFQPFLEYQSSIFTVFVPTSLAMEEAEGSSNKPGLSDRIIRFHIVPGKILARNLRKFSEVQTMSGDMLMLRGFGGKFMAGKGLIIKPDIEVENGVVHVVDRVLTPRTDSVAYSLAVRTRAKANIFLQAMRVTGLHPLINDRRKFPNIFFVPSDKAFLQLSPEIRRYLFSNKAALRKLLRYHIVPGFFYSRLMDHKWVYLFKTRLRGATLRVRSLIWNGHRKILIYNPLGKTAKTIITDFGAVNGAVNIIDNILIPPNFRIPGITTSLSRINNDVARKRA